MSRDPITAIPGDRRSEPPLRVDGDAQQVVRVIVAAILLGAVIAAIVIWSIAHG